MERGPEIKKFENHYPILNMCTYPLNQMCFVKSCFQINNQEGGNGVGSQSQQFRNPLQLQTVWNVYDFGYTYMNMCSTGWLKRHSFNSLIMVSTFYRELKNISHLNGYARWPILFNSSSLKQQTTFKCPFLARFFKINTASGY